MVLAINNHQHLIQLLPVYQPVLVKKQHPELVVQKGCGIKLKGLHRTGRPASALVYGGKFLTAIVYQY